MSRSLAILERVALSPGSTSGQQEVETVRISSLSVPSQAANRQSLQTISWMVLLELSVNWWATLGLYELIPVLNGRCQRRHLGKRSNIMTRPSQSYIISNDKSRA